MSEHPFRLEKTEKDRILLESMRDLTRHHRAACRPYADMLAALGCEGREAAGLEEVPFLPASLFKRMHLSSLTDEASARIQTSSGTGGREAARIVLGPETRARQQEALAAIGSSFLGKKRLPMLVIDTASVIKNKDMYTARTSAILGFSIFGTHRTFALREDYSLDLQGIGDFLQKYGKAPFLIFGFTFLVYQYFLEELEKQGLHPDMSRAVLVHGGGWKKMADRAVSREDFVARLARQCGIGRVIDYYGMAEQTGSIFMECPCGHMHASDYSAVLVRRPRDFSLCEKGETGLLQLMSVLPESYPGHSILTEDLGRILGEDDCPCGRKGVYFEVLGRLRGARLRGCSDTFAEPPGSDRRAGSTGSDIPTGEEILPAADEGLSFLVGDMQTCQKMPGQKPLPPFAPETCRFLGALSARLMAAGREMGSSELVTFAFWCRPAHVKQMAAAWEEGEKGGKRLGLGVSFQITPGNIALQFAYSMAAALLAGNCVILRLPGREIPEQGLVCETLRDLLRGECPDFAPRIAICRYGHDDRITGGLTGLCRQRVLWGSDASIAGIQAAVPVREGQTELLFPARDAAALMDAEYIRQSDADRMADLCQSFYNDTFLTDQNACTSPHILFWLGEKEATEAAAERFWGEFTKYLEKRDWRMPDLLAVNKLAAALQAAAEQGPAGIRRGSGGNTIGHGENTIWTGGDNRIVRMFPEKVCPDIWQYMQPGGFFAEYRIGEMGEMLPVLTKHCQTLVVCGADPAAVSERLRECGVRRELRIVPMGTALDFSLVWDGHDLIREMSREITGNEG